MDPNANSANTNMSRVCIHSEGLDNVKREDPSAEKEYLSLSFYHLIVLLVVLFSVRPVSCRLCPGHTISTPPEPNQTSNSDITKAPHRISQLHSARFVQTPWLANSSRSILRSSRVRLSHNECFKTRHQDFMRLTTSNRAAAPVHELQKHAATNGAEDW